MYGRMETKRRVSESIRGARSPNGIVGEVEKKQTDKGSAVDDDDDELFRVLSERAFEGFGIDTLLTVDKRIRIDSEKRCPRQKSDIMSGDSMINDDRKKDTQKESRMGRNRKLTKHREWP